MKRASAIALSPSNRFERRRERTRQDLLAAAERVLAEKGLHQTKISDIAAAADVEASYRDGIARGAFAPLPPALVAQAIIGMATQVLSWWTAHESVSIESLHETMFTLSLDGLRARTPKKGSST